MDEPRYNDKHGILGMKLSHRKLRILAVICGIGTVALAGSCIISVAYGKSLLAALSGLSCGCNLAITLYCMREARSIEAG